MDKSTRYPRQKRLLKLKKSVVQEHSHFPYWLPLSIPTSPSLNQPPWSTPLSQDLLTALSPLKFDSILVSPPPFFSWEDIISLPIKQLSAEPGFVFLWVGPGNEGGLEKGREALGRWGFRRCEEVVWVKPNKKTVLGPGVSLLVSSSQ